MSKKSKNPVSLLISELEEMSGGKVLFLERLEDPLPSSPTMDWLLSKEHILFSRPVGTLAFQVKLIRTTLLDVEQAWTSVFYLKSRGSTGGQNFCIYSEFLSFLGFNGRIWQKLLNFS